MKPKDFYFFECSSTRATPKLQRGEGGIEERLPAGRQGVSCTQRVQRRAPEMTTKKCVKEIKSLLAPGLEVLGRQILFHEIL